VDDVVLIAENENELRMLLAIVEKWYRKWFYNSV